MSEKDNIINLNKDKLNLGIEILRMVLCFWVIVFHYSGNKNKNKYKIINTFFHVPTFMILSFYLTYKIFKFKNLVKFKQRLERLLFPYILIPILYLVIIFYSSLSKKIIKKLIISLIMQYITGYYFYHALWFLLILIIYTVIFLIIFLITEKYNLILLQIIAIVSYWLQYNEYIYIKLNIYSRYLTINHFLEMLPIAVTGITLSSFEILKKLKNHIIKSIFFCSIIIYFIYSLNIFRQIKGCAISYNIAAISLFINFSLIPFNKIKIIKIINIIKIITRLSGGVYYFQTIIWYILNKNKYFKFRPFLTCFMIYLLGYLTCFMGTKIFRNSKLKYLFN